MLRAVVNSNKLNDFNSFHIVLLSTLENADFPYPCSEAGPKSCLQLWIFLEFLNFVRCSKSIEIEVSFGGEYFSAFNFFGHFVLFLEFHDILHEIFSDIL